jgi:hypothetical protein
MTTERTLNVTGITLTAAAIALTIVGAGYLATGGRTLIGICAIISGMTSALAVGLT